MKPALSVIFFTTLSGTGYGLLFLIGMLAFSGQLPETTATAFTFLTLSLGLVLVGLLSSTFHLKHPERALLAFSQWRSSWLSREGCAAAITFVPAGLFGIGWLFFGQSDGVYAFLAVLAALASVITVYCTAMIYGSLKAVPQWHSPLVPLLYLSFALSSGALWCAAILEIFQIRVEWIYWLALLGQPAVWALKLAYWNQIDRATAESSIGTATGLAALGNVRPLDPPHSEENFLLKEMGFRIARKYSQKLRRIALLAGAVVTPLLVLLAFSLDQGALSGAAMVVALPFSFLGLFVERWLFFAEAKHKVMLYYGEQAI